MDLIMGITVWMRPPSSSAGDSASTAIRRNAFRGLPLKRNSPLPSQLPFCRAQEKYSIMNTKWTGVPNQEKARRHAIVTGSNTGIGKATAFELARQGMVVTLACRNEERGKAVAGEISRATNNASVRSMTLDLSSLQSVRQFAAQYKELRLPLHVLVNNAGIMACPQTYTEDDFEQQLGVNHFGHFLLTSLLIDNLIASASDEAKSRVVVLASSAERIGDIDIKNLNYKGSSRVYQKWKAYGQSKLANCLFSYELAKRCQQLGLPIISNSMHPGIVNTKSCQRVQDCLKHKQAWELSFDSLGFVRLKKEHPLQYSWQPHPMSKTYPDCTSKIERNANQVLRLLTKRWLHNFGMPAFS